MLPSHKTWREVAFLGLAISFGMAPADPPPPDRIEEDWQVVVANPDPSSSGPQITTCMNPSSDASGAFATFYVNYQDYPDWQPGGMQVKAYGPTPDPRSNPPVLASSSSGNGVCETQGETITWTQRLSIWGGNVHFK
jgi:hypothetical protein